MDRTLGLSRDCVTIVIKGEKAAGGIDRLRFKEGEKRVCFVAEPAAMAGIVEPGFPSLSACAYSVIHRFLNRSNDVFLRSTNSHRQSFRQGVETKRG